MQEYRGNNIPRFVSALTATVLLVYLASCGPSMKTYRLYEGPELPGDQIALLVCKGETIQLNSVNGKKSPKGKDVFGNVTLGILPGDYRLIVSFSGPTNRSSMDKFDISILGTNLVRIWTPLLFLVAAYI